MIWETLGFWTSIGPTNEWYTLNPEDLKVKTEITSEEPKGLSGLKSRVEDKGKGLNREERVRELWYDASGESAEEDEVELEMES